ncbi:MAG: HEAT repeat domain-containing protein [Bacteriovoracaceae bacterium]|nr:HEAT repeat domain-containing protein [Bacteriovoracaceae bacterium]
MATRIMMFLVGAGALLLSGGVAAHPAPASAVNPAEKKAPYKITANVKLGQDQALLDLYAQEAKDAAAVKYLKQVTLDKKGKAVASLIEVMKNGNFPEKNRWIATFMLGKIMGPKAIPFLAKFTQHPSWQMRLASLKVLAALKATDLMPLYVRSLQDDSLIVRGQALFNIQHLHLTKAAPYVWAMLYDQNNYSGKEQHARRTSIIAQAIRTVGDLKFSKAQAPLLKMAQKKKYNDIFSAIDYALSKITGRSSPEGNSAVKRNFWQRQALNTTI